MLLKVPTQPTLTTCGPTCLQAVYQYYGDSIDLTQVINQVPALEGGGTLAVNLACHALRRGYRADIYTYNLQLFDPTWFDPNAGVDIRDRLRQQAAVKADPRIADATLHYLEFFDLGGKLLWRELTGSLIRGFLDRGKPVLTGLSATYLYECARERNDAYDDVAGEPQGHFVVLAGHDAVKRTVRVSDPLFDNPRFASQEYDVSMSHLKTSILLGIVTYDANLLVIEPDPNKRTNTPWRLPT